MQESVGQYSYFDLSSGSIVVFTDMRGFAALPETADPEELMDLLRHVQQVVARHAVFRSYRAVTDGCMRRLDRDESNWEREIASATKN